MTAEKMPGGAPALTVANSIAIIDKRNAKIRDWYSSLEASSGEHDAGEELSTLATSRPVQISVAAGSGGVWATASLSSCNWSGDQLPVRSRRECLP